MYVCMLCTYGCMCVYVCLYVLYSCMSLIMCYRRVYKVRVAASNTIRRVKQFLYRVCYTLRLCVCVGPCM